MAKITLGIWTEKNENLAGAIGACMKRTKIKRSEIALNAHISVSTFHLHMNNPENITLAELRAYANTLKMPKEDILDAIYLKQDWR